MRQTGIVFAVQRIAVFAIVAASFLTLAISAIFGMVGLLLAVLAYARFPTSGSRIDGWRYDAVSAVILPDWLGFIAGGILIALPVWAGDGAGVHVAAWITWPIGAAFLVLPVIGWRHACFALQIDDFGLQVEDGWGHQEIAFASIHSVTPWRGNSARRLRWLAPLPVLAGQPGPAGAVLMARDSSGFSIIRRDGPPLIVPVSGFTDGARAILMACARHGVPVAPGLSRIAPGLRLTRDGFDAAAREKQ